MLMLRKALLFKNNHLWYYYYVGEWAKFEYYLLKKGKISKSTLNQSDCVACTHDQVNV